MAVVGISFGSATSGKGFDVAATVTSIMTNMRAPETAWATQTTALTAQDAALSSLGTDMSALSTALATLTAFDGAFSQKQGAVSDTSAVALTNATTDASAGMHTLTVQNLANSSQVHSSAIPSGLTLGGSFTLQIGSGASKTITLDATNNSVAGLAAAINNLNEGVSATVITDSTGSRLSLTGPSGAENELTIDASGLTDSGGNSVSMTETQAAADAQYTLDGIPLTSSSNTISTALNGVTFQLLGTTSRAVTMQIANDTSTISSALASFVSAFNTLATALAGQEAKNSTGAAEPLFGDQTLSLIQSQISTALAFATGNTGKSSNLAQLGITVGTGGQLSLDSSALSTALSTNFAGVSNFFQNVGDFGQNLTTVLNGLGNSGNGALALRSAQNTSQEKTLADNKTNLETRLATYQTQLTSELNSANEVLQSIPSRLSEIDQIFAAITGYKSS
ncbi:flagellar capping protein [Terriglobus roseus DSM 18391]|uniref:Flagellar hook-associated protein 2 n=1 Tax=Terriglobus roseus (strain DSM 18391 / NRRL B-41598 / KBS 63) TaxID=926566 RepID=I3ZEG3_TERRK|nr:flagellar filament capping protein FliD [Terriglobus roseus]AFL87631.1 flagellar capping protein [Terriglobus roseus DSM 18391]